MTNPQPKNFALVTVEDNPYDYTVMRVNQWGDKNPHVSLIPVRCWHSPSMNCSLKCAAMTISKYKDQHILLCRVRVPNIPIGVVDPDRNPLNHPVNNLKWGTVLIETSE